MNKLKRNEQKMESAIVKAMNDVCETLKLEYDGFTWLTHFVNYANFPQSLKIVFVFDTSQSLEEAKNKELFKDCASLIQFSHGRGTINLFIDDPVFRGTMRGTDKTVLNAIFF